MAKRDDLSGIYGKAAESYRKLSRNDLAHEIGGQATFLQKAVVCALLMPGKKQPTESPHGPARFSPVGFCIFI